MSEPAELIDRYIAMWNETDPEARRRLIERIWSDDGVHVDPLARAERHDGIDGLVRGVQERFPRHRFRRTSPVDSHHGQVRFSWELAPEDGPPPVSGTDFGTLAEDGRRLRTITAFFDSPTAPRPLG